MSERVRLGDVVLATARQREAEQSPRLGADRIDLHGSSAARASDPLGFGPVSRAHPPFSASAEARCALTLARSIISTDQGSRSDSASYIARKMPCFDHRL